MTSKLIVNSLAADTGVSTITFADQAKMGNSIFHSTGFTIGDSFLHSTGVNLTNINATGVITATKFVGEVSVGSSITFEDNEKAYFGTGTDFSIYHDGSASYLHEGGTGGLIVKTNTAFQVFNSAGSQPAFTVTPGGGIDLYHNTTKMLETTAIGLTINGDVKIIDGENLRLGTGNDLLIYHASNHSYLENSTGELRINNSSGSDMILNSTGRVQLQVANGEKAVYCDNNGAVELYHNNVKKFETTSAGVTVTGSATASTFAATNNLSAGGNISLTSDTGRLYLGASNDLHIFHNGSNSYIQDNGTGALLIGSGNSSGAGVYIRGRHGEESIIANSNGSVDLYHDNIKRFETSATGVNLTNHSYSVISGAMGSTENIKIANTTSGGYIQIGLQQQDSDGLHHRGYIKASKGSAGIAGKLELLARGSGGGTNRGWIIDSAVGIQANQQVLPETDNTYDLGSSTKRWNDLYLSGGLRIGGTGTSNELDDYEEGTWTPTFVPASGSYTPFYTSGAYVRIGKHVTCIASLSINGSSNPSGEVQISGLPFSVQGLNSTWSGESGHGVGRWFYAGPNHYCFLVCDNSTDRIRVHKADGTFLNATNMNDGYNQSQFSITVTYLTDA